MRKKLSFVIITAMLLLAAHPADARRTARGSFFVDAMAGTSFSSWGAYIEAGQYNIIGFWSIGAEFMDRALVSQHKTRYSYATVAGFGEYMFRLYGTRSREFSAYLGAGLYFGAELSDPMKRLPAAEISTIKNNFVAGIYPKVQCEYYFWENIALIVQCSLPVNFNSKVRAVNCDAGLGVRYNF